MTLIKNGANDSARILGLRVLGMLLDTEPNRRMFTHFFEKPKELLKQLNEKDKEIHNRFPFYRYLLAVINSLVTSDAAKEQVRIRLYFIVYNIYVEILFIMIFNSQM